MVSRLPYFKIGRATGVQVEQGLQAAPVRPPTVEVTPESTEPTVDLTPATVAPTVEVAPATVVCKVELSPEVTPESVEPTPTPGKHTAGVEPETAGRFVESDRPTGAETTTVPTLGTETTAPAPTPTPAPTDLEFTLTPVPTEG